MLQTHITTLNVYRDLGQYKLFVFTLVVHHLQLFATTNHSCRRWQSWHSHRQVGVGFKLSGVVSCNRLQKPSDQHAFRSRGLIPPILDLQTNQLVNNSIWNADLLFTWRTALRMFVGNRIISIPHGSLAFIDLLALTTFTPKDSTSKIPRRCC
jgi:hypothetical protein